MSTKYTVVPTPQSNEELKQWIQDWIGFVNEASNETLGVSGTTLRKPKRDHGHPSTWNTELITDMSDLFFRNEWGDTTFNEDISSWDTSNVINMRAVRPVSKKIRIQTNPPALTLSLFFPQLFFPHHSFLDVQTLLYFQSTHRVLGRQ